MHEFLLISELIRTAETSILGSNQSKIVRLKIRIGAFCPISSSQLQRQFVLAAKGRRLEGALLDIEVAKDFTASDAYEILLESIEIEDP